MDYIQDSFAHIPLYEKWILALFAELARLTYASALSFCKIQESDDNSFRLHVLELLEIDVVDSLVLQFQIGINFESFC